MDFKKVLAICLPFVASLSILGVGFSSWVFGHNEVEGKNNGVSIHVTSDIQKGDISIESSPSMVVFSEGFGRKDDLTDGIDFFTKDDGESSYEENDKVILKYTSKDKNDSLGGNLYRLYVTVADDTFSNFVSLTSKYSNATEENGGYDFSKDLVAYPSDETNPYGYFLYTLKLNNVFQYVASDKKPLTSESYVSLCSAIANASITIKFVVI